MANCVEALVTAGADVNFTRDEGHTALMFAAMEGHEKCVEALITAGSDVNTFSEEGKTTLWHAVCCLKSDKCLEALISAGANLNCVREVSHTVRLPNDVKISIKDAGIAFIPIFTPVNSSAEVEMVTESDHTPLMHACLFNRPRHCVFTAKIRS